MKTVKMKIGKPEFEKIRANTYRATRMPLMARELMGEDFGVTRVSLKKGYVVTVHEFFEMMAYAMLGIFEDFDLSKTYSTAEEALSAAEELYKITIARAIKDTINEDVIIEYK